MTRITSGTPADAILPVGIVARRTQVGTDWAPTWADSALVNTLVSNDYTQPSLVLSEYLLSVLNPSTVSDLTVKIWKLETSWNGYTQPTLIHTFGVAKSTALSVETGEADLGWDEQAITGVTTTRDGTADYFKVGTYSAKFAMAAGAEIGLLASHAVAGTPLNLSIYTHLRCWIRSSIAVTADGLQLLLDNSVLCASPTETLSLPALNGTGFELVHVPLAAPASDAAIVVIGLSQSPTDLGAFNLWIDDVQAIAMGSQTVRLAGLFNDGDVRITIQNDTVLSTVNAFTAYVRLREVG